MEVEFVKYEVLLDNKVVKSGEILPQLLNTLGDIWFDYRSDSQYSFRITYKGKEHMIKKLPGATYK